MNSPQIALNCQGCAAGDLHYPTVPALPIKRNRGSSKLNPLQSPRLADIRPTSHSIILKEVIGWPLQGGLTLGWMLGALAANKVLGTWEGDNTHTGKVSTPPF